MMRRLVRRLLAIVTAVVALVGTASVLGAGTANAASGWRSHQLSFAGFTWCMDADTNTWNNNGGKVQMWQCNGHQNQQWWANYPTNQGEVVRTTINTPGPPQGPAKCLDDDTNNPSHIQLWTCNGQQQQIWDIELLCDSHGCYYAIWNDRYPEGVTESGTYNGAPVIGNNPTNLWYYNLP